IPSQPPFDLMMGGRDERKGLKLYIKRVFIMDAAEELLPNYLRFVRGVVDADDLPLNVSREILQHNRQVDRIKAACVKRVLDLIEKLARDEPEKFATFYKAFGNTLKEGISEDANNRERIAKLLRFASTKGEGAAQNVSLDEADKKKQEEATKEAEPLLKKLKELLGDRVGDVKVSARLTDSPSCLALSDYEMAPHLARLLREAGQDMPESKPTLEINPQHALLKRVEAEADEAKAKDLATLLLEQAEIAAGAQLPDPSAFVQRMNRVLLG